MSKVLKLVFINSEDKNTTLSVPNAKDGLDEATVRQAMKTITDAHAFNKDGVDVYKPARMAKYVETTTTTVFDDSKSHQN